MLKIPLQMNASSKQLKFYPTTNIEIGLQYFVTYLKIIINNYFDIFLSIQNKA